MEIRIEDRVLRGLWRRTRLDVKRLGRDEAQRLAIQRDILVAAMRLRSKRTIDKDARHQAAGYLIAILNSTAALTAVTNYLVPKKPPLGRLVAEDYLCQRALGEKSAVANRIVREAWGLTEAKVKDHVTHWRAAAAKSVRLLTQPDPGVPDHVPADLRSHCLRLRRTDSVTQMLRGESFEAWSRKRNVVKFRPKTRIKPK